MLTTLSPTMSVLLSVQLPTVLRALLQMSAKLAPLVSVSSHPTVSSIAPSPTVKPVHPPMLAKLVVQDSRSQTTYAP